MTPKKILQRAREEALDIIAITDHNSVENVATAVSLAADVVVIPAIEITTSEEAHILGLMPDINSASKVQDEIDERQYFFRTEDIKKHLDGISLNHPEIWYLIKEELREGVESLNERRTG